MKDITHYFHVPDKNATTISNKPPLQKSKDTAKSTNNKRKTKDSRENGETPAKPLDTDTKENTSKEKPSSAKKRKDTTTASKSKNKKPKLDVTVTKNKKECNEEATRVPEKRSRKSNRAIFYDSSEESFTVTKVRKQYTRKKKLNPESNDSIIQENCVEKLNHTEFVNTSVEVCILLEDCMKTNGNEVNSTNTESLSKLEESDSESCFVAEKKSKRRTKSKSNEKPEEEITSGNNLFNYFGKVEKSRSKIQSKLVPTMITVQAIVHSPPKDKSILIKEKNSNSQSSVVNLKNGKVKKKSCNFDDIKVVETEIIPTEKEINKTIKDKSETAFSESQTDEMSLKNSLSKIQPWKMRVKLTPSSKFDDIIKNTKSKKYKKIIWDSDSEEDIENKPKIEDNDDVEIVSITKAAPIQPEKSKSVKLAPLFCKKRENIKTTDNRIRVSDEAKRLFLESGLPEVIRKKMEEQKNTPEEEYNGEYFYPTCNHVQQKDPTSFVWNLEEFSQFSMKSSDDVFSIEEIFSQWWSPLNNESCKNQPNELKNDFDLKNEIALLKKQDPKVVDIHSSIKKLNNANEDANNLCWTEKYNPLNFEDMIGNTNSLYKLKEWIENHKNIRQIVLDSDQSSGDEFVDSDDSCNSADVKNNVAILVGPPGCGKTCAVYMLANELGFKVLEVNAGSNRTGKRIIDELLEATQSHRVKRTLDSKNFPESKKAKKKRKNKANKREQKTMSLILIEDADILFENYDEGFLSALNSLASLSKRPLIFTANNLNYPHLQKYNKSQNLILKFDYPTRSSINVWLKLIALTEGVKLTDEILIEMYKVAGSDLRKNLLQLQMLISSKIYSPISNKEQLFHQDWLSHVTLLSDKKSKPKLNHKVESDSCDKLFSDEEDSTKEEFIVTNDEIKSKNKEERVEDIKALLKSAKFLHRVANLDNFSIDNKQKIFPAEVMYQFDRHENHNTYQLSNDLKEFLKERLYSQFQDAIAQFSFTKYYNAAMQNRKISATAENVFMYFNPRIGNHVAENCDYLPTIRNIARSERYKVSSSMRRTSRYFSYLKSVNIDITDKEAEILCSTFI